MQIGNLEISREFLLALGIGFLVFFLVPKLFDDNKEGPQTANLVAQQKQHQQKVMDSLRELPIADAELRDCIRSALADRARIPAASSGAIQHARELEMLDCSRRQIRSLSGLRQLDRLRYLNANDNNIRDLNSLTEHPSLETLLVQYNPIETIGALVKIPRLREVRLPRLNHLDCEAIASTLQGVRYNVDQVACRIADGVDSNTASTMEKKSLDSSQQRELFDYERFNQ